MSAFLDWPTIALALAGDPRLTERKLRVLLAILSRFDPEAGEAIVTCAELEGAIGMEGRNLRKAMAELEGEGYLQCRKDGWRRHFVVILKPGQIDPVLPQSKRVKSTRFGEPESGSNRPGLLHKAGQIDPGQIDPVSAESGSNRPGLGAKAGQIDPVSGAKRVKSTRFAPPRVSPLTLPSSCPPVCVSGGVRAREEATHAQPEAAPVAGPSPDRPAVLPADPAADPAPDAPPSPRAGSGRDPLVAVAATPLVLDPACSGMDPATPGTIGYPPAWGPGGDDRIARLGGETLDGSTDLAIRRPGEDVTPEARKAREELNEWVARFCPQLYSKLPEWIWGGYHPKLIQYAIERAIDKGKTRDVSWIRGILEKKRVEGWTPPIAAPAVPGGPATPAPAPKPGHISARMQATRDRLEKSWKQQETSSDELQ